MRKIATWKVLLGLAALLAGGASLAEDKKGDAPDGNPTQPGKQHKALAVLAGSWESTIKMWMEPDKPPTEWKATSESKMIMGGRYLEDKISGEFGGMKFQGQALTAYDTLKKKYTYAWIDNLGTAISTATGTYDPDKQTYTYLGEETDPASGKTFKTKMVTHVIDKDKYEVDMYATKGDKEVKMMHIEAVRKAK